MMEKKYCTSCTTMRPIEGGRMKLGKINRWQCEGCATGKNPSIYSKKPKEVLIDDRERAKAEA